MKPLWFMPTQTAKKTCQRKGKHIIYSVQIIISTLNFLCNSFDIGHTPSQVMMSLIENYEESYFIRNLRTGRAYWNTSYYRFNMLLTMLNIKQALMMWKTAFNGNEILNLLRQSAKYYTDSNITSIAIQVQEDIKQAIKLNLAFFHSVLQLSKTDDPDDDNNRYWRNSLQ